MPVSHLPESQLAYPSSLHWEPRSNVTCTNHLPALPQAAAACNVTFCTTKVQYYVQDSSDLPIPSILGFVVYIYVICLLISQQETSVSSTHLHIVFVDLIPQSQRSAFPINLPVALNHLFISLPHRSIFWPLSSNLVRYLGI